MKNIFSKILLVSLFTVIMPFNATFAVVSMPTTTLKGYVDYIDGVYTVQLQWSPPDKNTYKNIYDDYEGYAVFKDGKPYALLKFSDNNYSSYSLTGIEKGEYSFHVELYYDHVIDSHYMHYVNPSNTVKLTVTEPKYKPYTKPEYKPYPGNEKTKGKDKDEELDIKPEKKPKHIKLGVDKSGSTIVLNWTAYTGTFDGYAIKLIEIGKNNKEVDQDPLIYYVAKTETSFSGLNITAGHKYRAHVLPYTSNGNGTFNLIENGKSNQQLIKIRSSKITLTAISAGGKIEGSFTSPDVKYVDGYAVYVVTGKKGEVSLSNASPVFLAKDKTTFTAYPTDTGYYTLKVYAYNELPDGTKVYHQPGSNWVTVVNTIL